MSCIQAQPTFRLLDANVGWDPWSNVGGHEGTHGVSGVDGTDNFGLRLKGGDEPKISGKTLSRYLPPAWLADGGPLGQWCLVGVRPTGQPVLLRRDACCHQWIDLEPELASAECLADPITVAACHGRIAIVHKINGKYRLQIWSTPSGRLAGSVDLDDPTHAVTFTSCREVVVSSSSGNEQWLHCFDWSGQPRGKIHLETASATQPMVRLRAARDGSLWAAGGRDGGPFDLWRIRVAEQTIDNACCHQRRLEVEQLSSQPDFYFHAAEILRKEFDETRLLWASTNHFCIEEPTLGGDNQELCFDRVGDAWESALSIQSVSQPLTGQLETFAIDSFIPRCRWHRLRMEADLPTGTAVEIQFATSESEARPHPSDWLTQETVRNTRDVLIDQPPGRYLFVRMKLSGTSQSTPTVRRVRLDFPRSTSLEQLPAVYRENEEAEDFTERFLSLFDAATEDLDAVIERFPALLDSQGVPPEVLTWIAGFVGIVFDSDWTVDQRRNLLKAVPTLFRTRGTAAGMAMAIRMIFGGHPVIHEHQFRRSFGVISKNALLGAVRLFGKSESRFRVGRSALGAAPVRSFGNPDHDAVRVDAHRFTVMMPSTASLEASSIGRLNRLIEHQKPAHAQHELKIGGQGFIIGHQSTIGIDTRLITTAAPVVGAAHSQSGNIVLNHTSILRGGPHTGTPGIRLDDQASIGKNTILE